MISYAPRSKKTQRIIGQLIAKFEVLEVMTVFRVHISGLLGF